MLHLMLRSKSGRIKSVQIEGFRLYSVFAMVGLLGIAVAAGGFYLGQMHYFSQRFSQETLASWQSQLEAQRQAVAKAKENAQTNLDTLTSRIAILQSHILRLDALGERLVNVAKLDPKEFEFGKAPAQGGPDEGNNERSAIRVDDFIQRLDNIEEEITSHKKQFLALETLFQADETFVDTYIQGRPVKHGWISSYYGTRIDPFHGRKAWHSGIDLAGKEDSDVMSVASGVVTWASRKSGYGNLVEIDHGNGYKTRYAHNKKIIVKEGELVEKGQAIAKMGSTGRSTGPHVHFEVHKNGKSVNPLPYVRRAALL